MVKIDSTKFIITITPSCVETQIAGRKYKQDASFGDDGCEFVNLETSWLEEDSFRARHLLELPAPCFKPSRLIRQSVNVL